MWQFEKFAQKILFRRPKIRHVNSRFSAAQDAQKADGHDVTKFMATRIARARIVHIIEIAYRLGISNNRPDFAFMDDV